MSNSKISALTSATTPLAGTEALPIVQSSATVKVAVSDLTAGRSVSGANFVVTSSTIPANGVYLPAANSVGVATNSTLRATVDASGNVGVGVTPSVWSLGKAFEIAYVGNALWSVGINNFLMTSNTYYNGGYKYAATGTATHYQQFTGQHQWWNAPSGTAGTAVTFTQAMTLSATGGLSLGTTTNAGAGNFLLTGNVVQGTAAKGFDFSANTPLAGKTSTILNWYEEGTWTPNQGAGLTLVGAFSSTGRYTRIGRQVSISGTVTGATSVAVTAAGVITSNLPFTVVTAGHGDATNAAVTASATVICTGTSVTSAGAITATGTITFSATYFV